MIADVVSAVLLLAGSALCLAASIGLLRFRGVLARMHAATKPQVLGLLLVLSGAAVQLSNSIDVWMLLLAGAFQLVTAPVAAHLLARVAHRGQDESDPVLHVDELRTARRER